VIADTDVLIDYVNGAEPGASLVAEALQRHDLVTTVISRFELRRGAARARHPDPLETLVARLEALPLDAAAADRAAVISRQLEERGQTLDRADCLIAGIALVAGKALLTHNHRHFARVPGLRLAPLIEAGEVQEGRPADSDESPPK
jgi:predicted nucleic acid-binding protein